MLIDSEFRLLVPPLSEDEFSQLESNLLSEGCRDPLVLWGDILIDGHNRHSICKSHGIPFRTVSLEFPDRDAVKVWIIDNQKGRRNLSDGWKFELSQVRRSILAERGKENLKIPTGGKKSLTLSKNDKVVAPHDTRKELASELGWSTGKVAQADAVRKESPEVWDKVKSGDLTVGAAYTEVKKPHVSHNSGENEWYTPVGYIEAARAVMGVIDVDPASSGKANETVCAVVYYTKDDDGLTKEWRGNVWMNPPYAQPFVSQFCELFLSKFSSGEIVQGLVLINNVTETSFGQGLLSACSAVCFPRGRVRFLDPSGRPGAPLQGQMVLYFGDNVSVFIASFKEFGVCLANAAK